MSDQRGAATPMVVACLSLLLALGAALGVVAAMVHDHRVAQSAADLAALAGAAALQRGDDGCAAAGSVAVCVGFARWPFDPAPPIDSIWMRVSEERKPVWRL